MRYPSFVTTLTFGIAFLAFAPSSRGQAIAGPRLCDILPVTELERHFGAKATSRHGAETGKVLVCNADFPDSRHGADLTSKPPGPVILTVEQRLAAMKPLFEKRGSEVKNFGSVGCFTDHIEIGETKLPVATCFLEKGGYLSLQLRSDDPKHLSFEVVKRLLEKAAALRK